MVNGRKRPKNDQVDAEPEKQQLATYEPADDGQ